ncbi:hypothetical protein Ga0609869_002837 [Rhodovulum iodosum]|uniref:DUF5333 domain-containing protein n=1 Tax=Rhodovulum iodosum TaxID=68291 RepID=A0ABV3XWR3_9RHOB|nr:DUF5333 domain-containing protein [Rhodovulum robiginosum]RSK36411.1 hypothetical protein EJA01_05030 [Rhodovulum robiginosum]
MRLLGHISAAAALAGALTLGTGPAAAAEGLPPLRENAHVWNSLFAAAVGDEIRKNCPTMSARIFRALRGAHELEEHALSLGYTEEQIEAFLDSDDEQDRMRAQRDAYLARHGVKEGDAESYCRLGREEIARGSLTGWLLREKR